VRPLWVPLLATTTMACVATWLWLRPEGPAAVASAAGQQ
jgi:hypothetical protein